MAPCVSSRTHPKSSTNVVKKVGRSWKGAPKKVPLTVKKNLEVESKKRKNIYDFRRTSTWNGKISDFCVYSRTYWRTTWCQSMRLNVLKDITLTTQCFLFVLFLLALLQQVFCNIPANQIIISTYSYLHYKFRIKLKEKITQTTHWLKSFYWISLPITKMKKSKGCAPTRIWRPSETEECDMCP